MSVSHSSGVILFFFFFQAEDGIRDLTVTGVQTCALPIFDRLDGRANVASVFCRVAASSYGPLADRARPEESIGKVNLLAPAFGQRLVALVCDDADHLDPFGLGRADADQDSLADS